MSEQENVYYVYIHHRGDNNEVFYVGKGKNKRATSKKNRNKWWHHVVSKCGYEVEILESCLSEESAFDLEIEMIKFYKECGHSLCNLTLGGEGSSGRKQTEEAKQKVSKARKGAVLSDAHKSKLREANLGKPKPEAQLLNMRKSQEKRAKPVYCSNGNRYNSVKEAIDWLRSIGIIVNYSAQIYNCIYGKLPHAHGFKWSYAPFNHAEEVERNEQEMGFYEDSLQHSALGLDMLYEQEQYMQDQYII